MTSTTRSKRRRRQASNERSEQQPRSLKVILTRSCYSSSHEHVHISGVVGGEEIDVAFKVPTVTEVHKHFNNPRKNGQTCVHGAFLLFRTFFSVRMSEHTTVKRQRGQISKISKEIWNKARKDVRDRFAKLAKETHDRFKSEVPLIWVNETNAVENNNQQVDHSDNNEANVAADALVSVTDATETRKFFDTISEEELKQLKNATPTESVFVPANEPTNNINAPHWPPYEFVQAAELQTGVYIVFDWNALQQGVHEQSVAGPIVQNTPAEYYYTYDATQQIVDYSAPLPAEPFLEYGIVNNYDQGIYWSEYNESVYGIDEQSIHR